MAAWFYLVKGRPNGPVDTAVLAAEIRAGRLLAHDLIYQERDTQWRESSYFVEFQKVFKELSLEKSAVASKTKTGVPLIPKPPSANDGQWVLLTRKTNGASGYKQKGPFSTIEIINQLKDGHIKITDYVWREGLKEWYKILAVPEIQEQLLQPEFHTQVAVQVPIPKSMESLTAQMLGDGLTPPPMPLASLEPKLEKTIEIKDDHDEAEEDLERTVVHVDQDDDDDDDDDDQKHHDEEADQATVVVRREQIEKAAQPPLPQPKKPSTPEAKKTDISFEPMSDTATQIDAKTEVGAKTLAEDLAQAKRDARKDGKAEPPPPSVKADPKPAIEKAETSTAIKKIRAGKAQNKPAMVEGQRVGLWAYFSELTPVKRFAFGVATMCTVVIGIFFIFWLSSYLDRRNSLLKRPTMAQVPPSKNIAPIAPIDAPPIVVQAPPTAPVQPTATPVAGVPTPPVAAASPQPKPVLAPVEVLHLPTFIRVQKINEGHTNPTLKIVTDASSQYFVKVQLAAEGGDVLDTPSFFVKRTLRKLSDRELILGDWKLPWGQYSYLVESEGKVTEGDVGIGTAEKDYRSKILKHRKNIVFDHNSERIGFVHVADHLARATEKLADSADSDLSVSAWTAFYRGWKKEFDRIKHPIMNSISERNRQKYVHPAQWLDLHDLHNKIAQTAKDIHSAKLKKADDTELTEAAHKQAKEVESLKNEMIQTSLWH